MEQAVKLDMNYNTCYGSVFSYFSYSGQPPVNATSRPLLLGPFPITCGRARVRNIRTLKNQSWHPHPSLRELPSYPDALIPALLPCSNLFTFYINPFTGEGLYEARKPFHEQTPLPGEGIWNMRPVRHGRGVPEGRGEGTTNSRCR